MEKSPDQGKFVGPEKTLNMLEDTVERLLRFSSGLKAGNIVIDELDESMIVSDGIRSMPRARIDNLEFLSVRACNCLRYAGIQTLDQLATLTVSELAGMRNLGKKTQEEIVQKCAELGVYLSKW